MCIQFKLVSRLKLLNIKYHSVSRVYFSFIKIELVTYIHYLLRNMLTKQDGETEIPIFMQILSDNKTHLFGCELAFSHL